MAENQPPANASPPPDTPLLDRSIVRATIGDANGNQRGPKPTKTAVQRLTEAQAQASTERKKRVFAEKNLAEANTKNANLWDLNEKRNLDLAQVTTDNKCLSDLLKSQKTLHKKELDAEKSHTTAQVQLKKDAIKSAKSSKGALKKDFDKQKKSYDSLLKSSNTNKVKISDLNCSQLSLLRTRTDLQNEVKILSKEVKVLTKKIDNQLDKKLNHDFSMQKMRNEYKQLDLDQAREKNENKKQAAPSKAASAALTLEDKIALESHKVDCKRRTKDDDFARDKMKKDTKARDVQSNLGFAANMLQQNQSNMNGGMWQNGSVADVSR
jgi:hypothetical protein